MDRPWLFDNTFEDKEKDSVSGRKATDWNSIYEAKVSFTTDRYTHLRQGTGNYFSVLPTGTNNTP